MCCKIWNLACNFNTWETRKDCYEFIGHGVSSRPGLWPQRNEGKTPLFCPLTPAPTATQQDPWTSSFVFQSLQSQGLKPPVLIWPSRPCVSRTMTSMSYRNLGVLGKISFVEILWLLMSSFGLPCTCPEDPKTVLSTFHCHQDWSSSCRQSVIAARRCLWTFTSTTRSHNFLKAAKVLTVMLASIRGRNAPRPCCWGLCDRSWTPKLTGILCPI